MGLIDLKTDLKSLRYGKDRLGGGSSNQPYIKSEIPSNEGDLGSSGGPDFLLRGGLLTPGKIANDTSRLTQMFFDFKSPNGLLFTAKQNVLSRTAVATNGEDKALNNGAYLPTSTILGAAGNPIGLHLNKQGINPFAGIYTGDNDFLSAISDFDPLGNPIYSSIVKLDSKSKLEGFLDDKINRKKKGSEGNDLFSYQGGPGSILGVGKTTISLSKDRTGINNPFIKLSDSVSGVYVLDTSNQVSSKFNPQVKENFIKSIPGAPEYLKTSYSFRNKIEQRVNLGNPGKKEKNDREVLDTVNARSLYQTTENNPIVPETNDLVKFRIGVIDNKNPENKTNIHFRAFIDSMSDSYSADWQTQKFMGRGENFYRYNGFDRSISLSWTVVAQSKAELMPMYHKLNYLASVCAPDYSDLGYMRGNLIKLTIGGYLYEQVGIMRSITYDIPQESPWEIAIPYGTAQTTNDLGVESDSSVKEMPHMIKVTGFQFTPIHDFVPSVQKNDFDTNGELISYGDEKYIALSNGITSGYNKERVESTTLQQQPIQPLNLTNNLSTDIII